MNNTKALYVAMPILARCHGTLPQWRGRSKKNYSDVSITYLEHKVVKSWEIVKQEFINDGVVPMIWNHFKNFIIQIYGNLDLEELARNKLKELVQRGLIESYAHDFHTLCAEDYYITTFHWR